MCLFLPKGFTGEKEHDDEGASTWGVDEVSVQGDEAPLRGHDPGVESLQEFLHALPLRTAT